MCMSARGPVNEDVFVAPASAISKMKTMDSDIQEITEQIHRLLLQVNDNKELNGLNQSKHQQRILGILYSLVTLCLFYFNPFPCYFLCVCHQPVHNSNSSGYGSLNSNDHLLGTTSSSESLNNGNPSKLQQEEEEVSGKARPVSKPKNYHAFY